MFLLQLTNYKRWLLRGATFVEMEEITQTLAGMRSGLRNVLREGQAAKCSAGP